MARPSTGWSAASPRVRKTFVSSLKSSIQWRTKSSTANSRPHLPGIGAPSPPSVSPLRHRSLFGPKSAQKAWKSETSSAVSVRLRSGAALVRACRQSWRGNRIAPLNPGVGAGLPLSILLWQQDCFPQSCADSRNAPVHHEQLGPTRPSESADSSSRRSSASAPSREVAERRGR